jgi:hypothetical protein
MGSSGESNKATVHSKLMAVIDPVTAGWGGDSFTWSYPDNIPLSWQQETELKPIVGGYGRYITSGIIILLKICPPAIRSKGLRAVEPLLNPQPARVYSIPADWR